MNNPGSADTGKPITNQRIADNQSTDNQPFTLTTTDLSKRFNREWIFRNFSVSFSTGKTYAITGPNGSGKSTLLQVLWGQVPPTSGSIHYAKAGTSIGIDDVFGYIAIATPYMDLIEEFTLQEQLDFHFRLRTTRENRTLAEIMDIMYLSDARKKYIGNFSSGMKQRLKLGLALYTKADIIFLDEPGTNLDERAFSWYKNHLSTLPENALVLVASNNPQEYPQNAEIINLLDYKK